MGTAMTDKHELGELRIALNGLYRRLAQMEQRLRALEGRDTMTGSIQGMSEEVVVTVPEGWFGS